MTVRKMRGRNGPPLPPLVATPSRFHYSDSATCLEDVMIPRYGMLGLAALALAASPALAVGKRGNESWGRPGVSLASYHDDALECANRAYGIEVEMEPYAPPWSAWSGAFLRGEIWVNMTPFTVPIYTTTWAEGYRHAAW